VAATEQDVQAQIDEIAARANERAKLVEATKSRAKFLDDPLNEFGHGIQLGIANSAGIPVDAVNALLNAAGIRADAPVGSSDSIQDVMGEFANFPEDLPDEPTGLLSGAGEGVGAAMVLTPAMMAPFMKAAMDPDFEINQEFDTKKFYGGAEGDASRIPRSRAARAAFLMKQLGQRIARTAVKNPKTFVASELLAAGAAGAAMEQAEQMGGGPGVQMGSGLAAGIVAGISPTALPRIWNNASRWGMKNFAPFSEAGARPRAAEQMQLRAEDAEGSAEVVRRMLDEEGNVLPEFEGLTPARVTGEKRLMAQEARVLADDPELDKMVREDLESAIKRAEFELRSLYDTPQGRQSWEQAVFQRVAPEGVEINVGTSEEMLDQLYNAFKPLYAEFRGYPIFPRMFTISRETTLETMLGNVPQTNRIQVEDKTREAVARRLKSIYQGFSRRLRMDNEVGEKVADSGDFLKLRQDIRAEARRRSKMGDGESVALYQIAEEKVNAVLRSQLDPSVLKDLGVVDSYYRNYKVTEDAIYRRAGTDQGLTPEGLLQSLRASASSRGSYARGEQMELRSLAAVGKPIRTIMNDPDKIRRLVANMNEQDLKATQDDFFDQLMTKATVTDEYGAESISGSRFKQMLSTMDDSVRAMRFDEDTIQRASDIADRMVMAQRSSPEAVNALYEDGPADILQLLATIVGAKHGQNVAGRGMGSSLVLAGWFAKKARTVLEKLTTNQARVILSDVQTDPELYAKLLTMPTDDVASQVEAVQYLKVYLATVAQRTVREQNEEPEETAYRKELERLRREARDLGTNF